MPFPLDGWRHRCAERLRTPRSEYEGRRFEPRPFATTCCCCLFPGRGREFTVSCPTWPHRRQIRPQRVTWFSHKVQQDKSRQRGNSCLPTGRNIAHNTPERIDWEEGASCKG